MKLTRKVDRWTFENWEFTGGEVERRERGEWSEHNRDGIHHDDYVPMMLYAYPLEGEPSDEEIKKIHRKTSVTVVREKGTDQYFLALTGGGMDLSQDIARAYIIAENRVPIELAREVNTQKELTQHGEDYLKVMKKCKQSIESNDYEKKALKKAIEKYEN